MGFDAPRKIKANAQGGILAAPAWTAFMTEVYRQRGTSPEDWNRPETLISREVDQSTGLLAGPLCSGPSYTEWYVPGTEPIASCEPTPFDIFGDSTTRRLPTLGDDTLDVFRIPPDLDERP